jgi:membrane protease YdiL (CAAX protease family)
MAHARRALECACLYVGLPAALALWLPGRPFLPLLWLAALAAAVALARDPAFRAEPPRGTRWSRRQWGPMLLRFGAACAVLAALVLAWMPDAFLEFPRQRPRLWALVMVLYPVLSALPQGVLYRALFFHRYAGLFPSPRARLLAGAAAFSLGHLLFLSPWTLALSFIGGLCFAHTYLRTRSLALSTVEHALYGCAVFSLGLGRLFYHGAVPPA